MDTKELGKRVLQSNLSDDDKIEIITRLNKETSPGILQPYPYKGNEINPLNRGMPGTIPLNHTEITCKGN